MIYDFTDYKKYLEAWIDAQPSRGYGQRGKMARSIGCQTAYISQVLNGPLHLSLEQAERMNAFLGHGQDEANFYLLLVQFGRAGMENLRRHFRRLLEEASAKAASLKKRVPTNLEVKPEDRAVYFGSWVFSAVHVLLTIPRHRTKAAIARELRLPLERVVEVLDFLVAHGLVRQEGNQFVVGQALIHLGNDSLLVAKHNANWRAKTLESLDRGRKSDYHYSSVVSVSRADAARLQRMVTEFIAGVQAVVQPSKEEVLQALCVDLFQVNEDAAE